VGILFSPPAFNFKAGERSVTPSYLNLVFDGVTAFLNYAILTGRF